MAPKPPSSSPPASPHPPPTSPPGRLQQGGAVDADGPQLRKRDTTYYCPHCRIAHCKSTFFNHLDKFPAAFVPHDAAPYNPLFKAPFARYQEVMERRAAAAAPEIVPLPAATAFAHSHAGSSSRASAVSLPHDEYSTGSSEGSEDDGEDGSDDD